MNSRDPPSKILLLIITYLPPSFPLTNDYLFETFKQYGEIKKILIFERGKTNKAFIEYYDIKHAIQARRDMMGKSITIQGGRLLIHFSRLKQLNLEVVDHTRGTQYQPHEVETQVQPEKQVQNLQNAPILIEEEIKPPLIDLTQVIKLEAADVSHTSEESPTKAIMETQLKQLERILDEDYANEVARSNLTQFDEQQQVINELLAQKPSKYLKVQNIDERVTAKMLYNIFNRFGHLNALLFQKKDNAAILQFTNVDHATISKELLNNIMFFSREIRILFHQIDNLEASNPNEEYYFGSQTKFKIVPLSKVIVFSGIYDLLDIQDMVKLVGKIQEIKLEQNCIQITMVDIYEALKVISVLSEYEYKGNKINLTLK
ncbi:unnamed protein product [Paramecium octaurelia]|uniref:RRM domain-containing protein n=1 Tax=Paramecium octaurelia TaxID=43137 RepID=A0A8S1S3Z0_PAROT|nr:unnamed protein product [Paramecium octaurelia]